MVQQRLDKPKPKPKTTMVMWKPMEHVGETTAVGRSTIKMAGRIRETAETGWHRDETWFYSNVVGPIETKMAGSMWIKGVLCTLQAFIPLIQWMHDVSIQIVVGGMDLAAMPMSRLIVTVLDKWKQLPKVEMAEYSNGDNDPENLQVSGQVAHDRIPGEIFQGIKSGMHGSDFKLVEQGTKSLLQAGSGGSPGGKQVRSLAAGCFAQALGGLTKQNFHGAGHAKY